MGSEGNNIIGYQYHLHSHRLVIPTISEIESHALSLSSSSGPGYCVHPNSRANLLAFPSRIVTTIAAAKITDVPSRLDPPHARQVFIA